ncbi:MAG: choline ABC transporter permease, partial [Treponema sp.]|nr:choline ABC transporter permease [Treponema sp.]
SVGLVTIAAFIGAGGLGYTIYSGIRTNNTTQIIAGALLACILALIVDWLGSLIEKIVTPECFKKRKN